MKISIIAIGTRGDVQPAIALGIGLMKNGHEVIIFASNNFDKLIRSYNLISYPTKFNIQDLMNSKIGNKWVNNGTKSIHQLFIMKNILSNSIESGADIYECCKNSDLVISSFTSDIFVQSIAEKLNIPHVSIPLQPSFTPTRSGFATMNAPVQNKYSIINYIFGKLFLMPSPWFWFGKSNNFFRKNVLKLKNQTKKECYNNLNKRLVIHGYSSSIIPHPLDYPMNYHTVGYWFLEDEKNRLIEKDLANFLSNGTTPICFGFGSMTGGENKKIMEIITATIKKLGVRAIILSGWSGMKNFPIDENIFVTDSVSHNFLFPKVSLIVHHGGAGTTAACLKAGTPMVIIPHLGDQPFWGRIMNNLKVAPKSIYKSKLNKENLFKAIKFVLEKIILSLMHYIFLNF